MSKLAIGHGQNTVPMNLFATWEVDRSSPQCIPRICSLALGKLVVIKELDKDAQSVFIAVKMQGSKRVLRSNEINLPPNGLLNADVELTFSLQYPHFIKRDGNILQIMLQRKKRYKNRAMLGYKTLAMGTLDMARIIQKPIVDEYLLDLISTNKDRRSSIVVAAQVGISSVYSTPTDEGESGGGMTGKQTEVDRSPDFDNYTDDEETFSSDQEMGSDVNPQELYMDEETGHKRKERRKVRMSSASRQQNFIKAKLVALLRRFKQVADEGLEPDMVQDPDGDGPSQADLDFLYDEIEDLNLSDSCPEVEDNISIVSTPKPKLRPFFDRTSYSSSQTEICSLRDQHSAERGAARSGSLSDSRDNTLERQQRIPDTFESLQNSDKTPAIDQSDTSDQEEDCESVPSTPPESSSELAIPGMAHSGSEPGSPSYLKPSTIPSTKRRKRSWPRSHSPPRGARSDGKLFEAGSSTEDLNAPSQPLQTSLMVINGPFSLEEDDADGVCGLQSPVLLINSCGHMGHALTDAFRGYFTSGNKTETVILATSSPDQLCLVFNALMVKLQKFITSNSQQPMRVKVGVAGTEPYMNFVLQRFVELISLRSPDWLSYFLFLPIPLGKHSLGQYLSSLDPHYAKLFSDQTWREYFDKAPYQHKALSPCSTYPLIDHHSTLSAFEKQQGMDNSIVRRVLEYVDEASAALPLAIAEAMLTFGEKSDNEDSSQKFVPFICGVKVGENEPANQPDSDKEDAIAFGLVGLATMMSGNSSGSLATSAYSPATGAISTPTSPSVANISNPQQTNFPGLAELKMGLQVDYWKDKDSTKYTLKSTFRSFNVFRLPSLGEHTTTPGLAVDFVTIGKKNIMRLPGKKGKEKESESKIQAIGSINRIICTSKHQHNLLKVKIDGIEWKEVKFFQLSSHWSSHVKVFPVGLFSAH